MPIIGEPGTADWDENSRENHLMAKFTLETKESKGTCVLLKVAGVHVNTPDSLTSFTRKLCSKFG